jgi:UDP-N-acetylglucosamine--N-acetylmuramyl-(pentapeptide) pyrophosphoryl-undecaprenol N-acetylglucosamine transferase
MTVDPIRPPQAAGADRGPRVLIAAGGTGGHVFPGLALARALKELEPAASVRFAGTSRGIENQAVPAAGFPLHLLPILPLSRRLSMETVLSPFAAAGGTAAALRLLRRERIEVVAGMGGYVTLPVAAAAKLAGIPVVLHEQNAIPGVANRALRPHGRGRRGGRRRGVPAGPHGGDRQPGAPGARPARPRPPA